MNMRREPDHEEQDDAGVLARDREEVRPAGEAKRVAGVFRDHFRLAKNESARELGDLGVQYVVERGADLATQAAHRAQAAPG
jgi:hypothetical protein